MEFKQRIQTKFILLLIFIAFSFSHVASATSFLLPNETHPLESKIILETAPSGAYFSVGTERGFMAVSLCPNADYLLLMDANPNVVLYNQINIALLEASSGREDYLYLRLNATFSEWVKRTPGATLDAQAQSVLKSPDAYQFWKLFVRNEKFDLFNKYNPNSTQYKGANYLFNDVHFLKLQRMAKNGRILAVKGDLNRSKDLIAAAKIIRTAGLKLSVVDLSNAWWKAYAGPGSIKNILNVFRPIADSKSILLLTQYVTWFDFGYFGSTFEKLSLKSDLKAFLHYLRNFELNGVNHTYLTHADAGQLNSHLRYSASSEALDTNIIPRERHRLWRRIHSWCEKLLSL